MPVVRFHLIFSLLFLVLPVSACATLFEETYIIDVRVVDQDGEPVEGANVSGGFFVGSAYDPAAMQPSRSARGVTDRNGEVRVSGPSLGSVDVQVTKEGFYRSMKRMPTRGKKRHEVEIVLRDIREPIPLYARSVYINLPSQNHVYGFNLLSAELADRDPPWANSHILFEGSIPRFSGSTKDMRTLEYEVVVKVSFPNQGDGLILSELPPGSGGSTFKSNYKAPEKGYEDSLLLSIVSDAVSGARQGNVNQPLYLRVATRLDEDGEVESAIYCKIYPGISLGGATADAPTVRMTYYCNPTPNDRNVEFDTQRNLFTDRRPAAQVGAP